MIKVEMKPMVYGEKVNGSKMLYFEERDDGFKIAIVNVRGTHPCAYIEVPKKLLDELESKTGDRPDCCYDDWDASVHYGFTYADKDLVVGDETFVADGGFWLGWDYAHYNDFVAMPGAFYRSPRYWEITYTTKQILDDANNGIKTLHWYGLDD